jgi:hypothetical protein
MRLQTKRNLEKYILDTILSMDCDIDQHTIARLQKSFHSVQMRLMNQLQNEEYSNAKTN